MGHARWRCRDPSRRSTGRAYERPADFRQRAFHKNPAITYSRAIRTTIGPGCLTAVFGMGTGVAIQVCSPESSKVVGGWWLVVGEEAFFTNHQPPTTNHPCINWQR